MEEISIEEFKEKNGNVMAGVSTSNTQYYDLGNGKLGVVGETERGARAYRLSPSSYFNGEKRVEDSSSFSGDLKTSDPVEEAEEWLS